MATSASRKPAAARKPTAKTATAAKASAAEADQAGAAEADQAGAEAGAPAVEKANVELRLKGLVDRVIAASGAKKPAARSVTEAVLKELGDALSAGQVLNLPGLGKLRVTRPAEGPAGAMTLKLRRPAPGSEKPAEAAAEPLADAGEDS
jgi:nucleoid DNA-binding protein